MGIIHAMGLDYHEVLDIEEIEIKETWVKKSEKALPNRTKVEHGKSDVYDSEEDLYTSLENNAELYQRYRKADNLQMELKGGRNHAQLMLQIHSYLYGEYRPDLVEKKNMDLLDYENKVVGEAGKISAGGTAGARFARFLGFNVYDKQPEKWKMVHNPYGTDHFKVYRPTDELLTALANRPSAPYDG
ncbi:hypothetical protein KY092_08330 [Natronomonas gomsonensis]|uniref:hypothetical protein n=1 Tax=Natronomonas gomsonensis TaxID=1046043 RepID=UPI0020CA3043|nr:hypothetical protein [Natronomonas gomsonensis]MCY4730564.1 hypothetical protein [Natronomonas gomsonensis]